LPRASAAITAVGQRGPGHRAPCGVISRQARQTRSPWVSSQESGGAAPVDRCTDRRCDTNDCRQIQPVGEAPSRRPHRGIGQNHIPEGWVEAVVRGRGREPLGWDGSHACPSAEGSSISMGTVARGVGLPWIFLRAVMQRFRVGFHRGPWGARGASAGPRYTSPCTGSGSVAAGGTGGSRGAEPSGAGSACAVASERDVAASRGWKRDRRVAAGAPARKGGAWQPPGWYGRPRVAQVAGGHACLRPLKGVQQEGPCPPPGGLASGPSSPPPGGIGAGPEGAATAWGTGRTAWSTSCIGGRAIPGQ